MQPQAAHQVGSDVAIDFTNVTKRYGHFTAVNDITLAVRSGEVHSLVGANGAGKSTLLGILSGRISASDGNIRVFGHDLPSGSPRASKAAGIAIVYQELTVLPALTAVANVFLGNEKVSAGLLNEGAMRTRYLARCKDFGIDIPPDALGRELSVASAQMLEIMRAVELDARILILDEPTASLSYKEREFLLDLIQRLKARGVTIMLVSHNLDEVLSSSNMVTVLRNGRVIEKKESSGWDKRSLVRAMTGNDAIVVAHERVPKPSTPIYFSARNVTLPGVIEDISLEVRAGEVLGLAGLVGAGRTTLLRSMAGAEAHATGEISLDGKSRPVAKTPRSALDQGIALLPEERKTEGLILGMTIGDNVTLPALEKVSTGGLVHRKRQFDIAQKLLSQFTLSRAVGEYPVGELSGGNQQKVVLSKLLLADPKVLLIDEPTRGIDVAAKVEVLQAIRRFAEEKQRAVVVTSTEIEEVIEIADRILVMANGRIVGELDNSNAQVALQDVLDLAFGVNRKED